MLSTVVSFASKFVGEVSDTIDVCILAEAYNGEQLIDTHEECK